MKEYEFEAVIQASEFGNGGAYIEFPFSVEEEFGEKGRVKVVCFFEDYKYRGSLVRMGTDCHIIGITKAVRSKIGKSIGDKLQVRIFKDENERTVDVHPLLIQEFDRDKTLRESYEKLSFTQKKEIMTQLTTAKRQATLKTRLDKVILELKGK